MSRQKKMSLIILTLSLPVACAIAPFPSEPWYIVDLQNQICAEYTLIDNVNLEWKLERELPLVPQGPCDRLFAPSSGQGFINVKNWIRDAIAELSK